MAKPDQEPGALYGVPGFSCVPSVSAERDIARAVGLRCPTPLSSDLAP